MGSSSVRPTFFVAEFVDLVNRFHAACLSLKIAKDVKTPASDSQKLAAGGCVSCGRNALAGPSLCLRMYCVVDESQRYLVRCEVSVVVDEDPVIAVSMSGFQGMKRLAVSNILGSSSVVELSYFNEFVRYSVAHSGSFRRKVVNGSRHFGFRLKLGVNRGPLSPVLVICRLCRTRCRPPMFLGIRSWPTHSCQ
ncbi:hypothetical protein CROQUDRAFT_106256 [Cronartium quercuum f. sp. fusiforme G11]|uniref:Uncharacterized protein n=1 Tax=Cronartium quercuum f. sp. fusiforme G11 TaxID=708437 RepID=A0A9P6NP85_9BASI|nr:hypothetical protein CROQUDRAFT_106256 [Cronartium quercuum f. sp. fusiforme G11]